MNKKKMKKLQEEKDNLYKELSVLSKLRSDKESELGHFEYNRICAKRDLKEINKKIDKIYKKLNRLNGENVCCTAPY